MADVLHFAPNEQALENVPHMLRYFADMIERDQDGGTKTDICVVVFVQDGDPAPAFFIAGAPNGDSHHPLYVAGILDWCRAQMLTVIEPTGGRDDR